jgi:hypothetical protein
MILFFESPGSTENLRKAKKRLTVSDLQGMYSSLDQWKQLTGYDTNSVSAQPSLDANYVPTASDTVAKDKGVSFASLFTTDKLGVVRPQGPAWDIGAFEFASGAATLPYADSCAVADSCVVADSCAVADSYYRRNVERERHRYQDTIGLPD